MVIYSNNCIFIKYNKNTLLIYNKQFRKFCGNTNDNIPFFDNNDKHFNINII